MDDIKIDLSKQKFSDGISIFKEDEVSLKHKNFIFARNGSGKSTFSSIINSQLSKNYDVHIYNGYERIFGENEYLNAFSLSVNASENEDKIKEKQKEVKEKQKDKERVLQEIGDVEDDFPLKGSLKEKFNNAEENFDKIKKEIEDFYTESAASIKNMSSPQISKTTYNKINFKKEIPLATQLNEGEIKLLRETASTDEKRASKINWENINLEGYLQSVNEILNSKVEEKTRILRFNNKEKINFARRGLEIHKHKNGEICAFCGNPISEETFEELEKYFSADEVKDLSNRITIGKKKISDLIDNIKKSVVNESIFYPDFREQGNILWNQILEQKNILIHFCEELNDALDDKERNLFERQPALNIQIPNNIDAKEYNILVESNNDFGSDLVSKKELAKNKLRRNIIKIKLDEFQYGVKKLEQESAFNTKEDISRILSEKELEKEKIQERITDIEKEIDDLKPKAEKQAIEHINQKLNGSVMWKLDYSENNETGYYWISQRTESGDIVHRGVKELSTGEKNIIALLYFLEKLEDTQEHVKLPKVILFDDPMNSNDADKQYLIITEIQKLYRNKYPKRYNPQKDYIVIMTHNVHFYLNISPYGSYEDNKGKTKYDKSNFYRISQGKFLKIENEKQDFKTNYDALWLELNDLLKNGSTNSMLNSMRRIIETYIRFSGVDQDTFYKNNEKYLKLFNVNSHSAIDSLSAESFTETPQELIKYFHQIFIDNGAEAHFDSHWKSMKESE